MASDKTASMLCLPPMRATGDPKGRLTLAAVCTELCRRLASGDERPVCEELARIARRAEEEQIPAALLEAVSRMETPQGVLFIARRPEACAAPLAALRSGLPQQELRAVLELLCADEITSEGLIRQLRQRLPEAAGRIAGYRRRCTALMSRMYRYLDDNAMRYDFSVQAMAEEMALPPGEMSRIFRCCVGCPLAAYVWELRLREAKRLLAETTIPVCKIVQLVGYVDASSFSRRFQRAAGCTPGEFRQRQSLPVAI